MNSFVSTVYIEVKIKKVQRKSRYQKADHKDSRKGFCKLIKTKDNSTSLKRKSMVHKHQWKKFKNEENLQNHSRILKNEIEVDSG